MAIVSSINENFTRMEPPPPQIGHVRQKANLTVGPGPGFRQSTSVKNRKDMLESYAGTSCDIRKGRIDK
jgi:hypothetical protein